MLSDFAPFWQPISPFTLRPEGKKMTRIIVTNFPESAEREFDVERAILGPGVEIVRHRCDDDEDKLIAACSDADVILADCTPLPRSVIEKLHQCRLVSFAATGFDSIDLQAAIDADISVCAIDEYCTSEVADHTILLMLSLCRRLLEYHHQVQEKCLWQFDSLAGIPRMRDMTLGIIGLGRIGQAVARRARGFGMTVVANDLHPAKKVAAELGVRFCNLKELFARSDIISLNCRLTSENEQMIDAEAFKQMTRKPVFINCSRAGLLCESALTNALDSGQISAAGLDLLCDETPDLNNSPLVGRRNVILTPHMAFYSDASMLESREISAHNIRNFLDGKHEDVRRYIHHAVM
jgi:phosphoglycerate dehydrogenase-like enzyme